MRELVLLATVSLVIVATSQQVYSENLTNGYEYAKMVESFDGGELETLITPVAPLNLYSNFYDAWEYDSHIEAFKSHREAVGDSQGSIKDCSTDEECSLLAKLILYEARGESEHCQQVVASVVVNRVNDSRWGDSVEGVIKQPKQFSFLQDWHKQTPPTKESEEIAKNIAKKVLEGDTKGDYLWYHSNRVKPKWSANKKGVVICNQTFYNML